MATVSADIDIHAEPRAVLDVLADLPDYPSWSAVHKSAVVERRHPNGRPARAKMAVSAVGLTDEQTLDYRWGADHVEWTLVHSGQQRAQRGSYTIHGGTDGISHVHYELTIDPLVPMPGILVRQVMRKAVNAATTGLKQRVEG
ncbi:MAG TPA: SRPBCC family protein [Jatrophihabitans sp.]|nr:SRPBCC family protein [Jatrophihabitans sp.]